MSPDLGDRSAVLRERIAAQEQDLRLAVRELELAARQTFDLQHRVESHPLMWITGAFALGFWMGGRSR